MKQCGVNCDVMRLLSFCCCRQLCLCLLDLCHLDAFLARRLDGMRQRGDVDLTLRWLGEVVQYLTSQTALLSKTKPKQSEALRHDGCDGSGSWHAATVCSL